MRIAIIGTGIAGLTAAHLLHPEHELTVFEAGDHVGGHTNTIRVDTDAGTWHVDTGFIVLNDRNYPRFEALLDELAVARQATNMSFSVSAEDEDFEYSSRGLRGLVAQPANLGRPRFLAMVADYVRFNRAARDLLVDPDDDRSLGAFLEDERFSRWFIDRLLVPQAAAVWSADPGQIRTLPARFLVQFFAHHGMLSLTGRPRWSTIAGGAARYVEALTAPFAERIRLRTPVVAVGLQDITDHYAETLAHWRRRFLRRLDDVAALGYDERFRRLWDLYLAYCEAGFRERRIRDVQLLLAKPRWRGDALAPGLAAITAVEESQVLEAA